jgi:hypothetical protein
MKSSKMVERTSRTVIASADGLRAQRERRNLVRTAEVTPEIAVCAIIKTFSECLRQRQPDDNHKEVLNLLPRRDEFVNLILD